MHVAVSRRMFAEDTAHLTTKFATAPRVDASRSGIPDDRLLLRGTREEGHQVAAAVRRLERRAAVDRDP